MPHRSRSGPVRRQAGCRPKPLSCGFALVLDRCAALPLACGKCCSQLTQSLCPPPARTHAETRVAGGSPAAAMVDWPIRPSINRNHSPYSALAGCGCSRPQRLQEVQPASIPCLPMPFAFCSIADCTTPPCPCRKQDRRHPRPSDYVCCRADLEDSMQHSAPPPPPLEAPSTASGGAERDAPPGNGFVIGSTAEKRTRTGLGSSSRVPHEEWPVLQRRAVAHVPPSALHCAFAWREGDTRSAAGHKLLCLNATRLPGGI